ncbi:MAG: YajQ family cyclic di-GMP-binding protein [Acidobacteria bacterium]|nr:MAG: YajQ family cyclic di-GMP-binding protein [Acidobacteriota bacterium]
MASDNSFDVVSKIDLQEVANAIQQAIKEIHTRFDLKDSKSDIALEGVKRHVPLKGLDYGAVEPAAGSTVRQRVKLQQGIPIEKAREIVKLIKDAKLKVQASIQGDTVRVSGKDRDTLQQVIATLKGKDFGIDMQFTNYRSN